MRDPYICYRTACRYHSGDVSGCRGSCNYFFITGETKTSRGEADITRKCGLYDTTPLTRGKPQPIVISAKSPPERMGRKYDWKRFRSLWDDGRTDGEIAEEMRCNKETVAKWRRAEGLPFRRKRAKITREELRADWADGLSDPKIAAKRGVSPATVLRMRREMGLPAVKGGAK